MEIDAVVQSGPPIYKQWWFWTAAGVLVAGAAVATSTTLVPIPREQVLSVTMRLEVTDVGP